MQNKVTRRIHLIFCLMTFALKYEDVSAVEGVSDGSSEGTAIFEVKFMGAFQVTIDLHLKMHIVVHLLVQRSSQNNSIKGELQETLYVTSKCIWKHKKFQKKVKKKNEFDVIVHVSLDDEIKGTPLNLKFGSLRVLYILCSAEQAELLTFSN